METITNKKTEYKITAHARLRYRERVSEDGSSFRKEIKKWLENALIEGYEVDRTEDGKVSYRYGKYLIVMCENTLITISYYKYNDFKPLKDDLNRIIARRLRKEVSEMVKHRKEILIQINELDIERIKSKTVGKQKRLGKEMSDLNREAANIKTQIKALIDLANKHGLKKSDIIFEGDMI